MGAGNTKAREREEICPKTYEYLVQKLSESTESLPCVVPGSAGKKKEELEQLQIAGPFVVALSQTAIRLCEKRLSNTSVLYSCFSWP